MDFNGNNSHASRDSGINSDHCSSSELAAFNSKSYDFVQLPEGEDLNEWLAVNTTDFFNQVGMLYGTIAEFCTEKSCPIMSAGPNHVYQWIDVDGSRGPMKYTAKQYIHRLLHWTEQTMYNEEIFPSKFDAKFPMNYFQECKIIFKRLFRIYAHVYHNHKDHMKSLKRHVNTSFKHFILFVKEFNLIEDRDLAPLEDIIAAIVLESNSIN